MNALTVDITTQDGDWVYTVIADKEGETIQLASAQTSSLDVAINMIKSIIERNLTR